MKTMKATWTGIRPLLMHNGLLADPTNPYVISIKKITAKKNKKTDADNHEIGRLEWLGSLYLGEDGKSLVIPSDNIERCIQEGARKSRLGKDAQAAVFCSEVEVPIQHDSIRGRVPETLFDDPRFVLRKGVKITTNRVIRVRPIIPTGWAVSFTLEYDETIINQRNLEQAMRDAGSLIGLGDWRPKFGRFTVEVSS
jgi:hypothetical protein